MTSTSSSVSRLWAPALSVLFVACGAKTGLPLPTPEPEDSSVDARDTGVDAPLVDAPPDVVIDAPVCIPFRAPARLANLEIFILLDSSGSMEGETSSGLTKAQAISSAIEGFVTSPDSDGLGVGLTFFPFEDPMVPEFCSNDRQCGEDDACLMPDICVPSGDSFCFTNDDCGGGDFCEPLGRCGGLGLEELCIDIGSVCSDGSRCVDLGLCENRTSCDIRDYSRPEVDLAVLPGVSRAIVTALSEREQTGGTPTAPALEGALNRATRRGATSPGSKIILLLATDGFPAACDDDIDFLNPDPTAGLDRPVELAAQGVEDGIQTFVIGVFSPEEERDARRNLTRLAIAGGTDEALVITTDEPVTDRLLAILNDLRRDVRTCVYAIPAEGAVPDPRDLEVRLLPRGGDVLELERVDDETGCNPRTGGFYFQQDIEMGARPGFIELCPSSCELAARPDVTVEMQAGCRDEP